VTEVAARPAVPAPAATVVLLRPSPSGPEVLLTQRPATMVFGPGLHVFPGGRLDPGDGDERLIVRSTRSSADAGRMLGGALPDADALALHHAAIRELIEEAGILLADGRGARGVADLQARLLTGVALADALEGSDCRLRTDRLAPIGHWTTPPFMSRRFSTWFFVADLPSGVDPVFAPDEVVGHRWLTPERALEQLGTGEIQMWVPTTSILERLIETGAATAHEVAERLRFGPTAPPRIVEERDGVLAFEFGAAGGLPGRTCRTLLVGRRDVVVVDPGDPSDPALDAIADEVAARDARIVAVLLSAPDPDHAAAAEAIAIPLEIPILGAPGAGRRLPYEVRELADGDRLPGDSGLRVVLGPAGSARLELVGSAGE
jgi:8-oxo-dGTP pyrophosphatase MutT (NUDIX family)